MLGEISSNCGAQCAFISWPCKEDNVFLKDMALPTCRCGISRSQVAIGPQSDFWICHFSKIQHECNKYTLFTIIIFYISHLSKYPSDLKQNGTQEKTPFSSTVFHTLSHSVIRFVASVSSKTTF